MEARQEEELCVDQLALEHYINIPPLPPLSSNSKLRGFSLRALLLCVKFKNLVRIRDWKKLVHQMLPKYQSTWKKAGIFDAIRISTYEFPRHNEVILGVAEKWCPETNTFNFSCGEATITLEDIMVLGGFSVLGESVNSLVLTPEMEQVNEKLCTVHCDIKRMGGIRYNPRSPVWMQHFMSGDDLELENVAFLCVWLSRFVFPNSSNGVTTDVFRTAIHLAGETLIALAPAVLASIYKDMSLLNERMNEFNNGWFMTSMSNLRLEAPLHLVKLWAWERFPALRPLPGVIRKGDPTSRMWENTKVLRGVDVRLAIEMGAESFHFQWQPYAGRIGVNQDEESIARCLKVSEIVGFDNSIQLYLPDRVAKQFGFGEGIPENVLRITYEDASSYDEPVVDTKSHAPPGQLESSAGADYRPSLVHEIAMQGTVKRGRRSSRSVKRLKTSESANKLDTRLYVDTQGDDTITRELEESRSYVTCNDEQIHVSKSVNINDKVESAGLCGAEKLDSMGPMENIVMEDVQVEELVREKKDAEDNCREVPDENCGNTEYNVGTCSSSDRIELLGKELELRIEKLERTAALLKAMPPAKLKKVLEIFKGQFD